MDDDTLPLTGPTGIWDVDAIIISHLSLNTIGRLYTEAHDGFEVLCLLLGVGSSRYEANVRVLLLLHRMVEMRLGESFPLTTASSWAASSDGDTSVGGLGWFWVAASPYMALLGAEVETSRFVVDHTVTADIELVPPPVHTDGEYYGYLLDDTLDLVHTHKPDPNGPPLTVNKWMWTILDNLARLCWDYYIPPPVYPILTRILAPYVNECPHRVGITPSHGGVKLAGIGRYDSNGYLRYDTERYFCTQLVNEHLFGIEGDNVGRGKGVGYPHIRGPRHGLRAWANDPLMASNIGQRIIDWFVQVYDDERVTSYVSAATITPEDQDAIIGGLLTHRLDDDTLPWQYRPYYLGHVNDAAVAGMAKRVDGLLTILTRLQGWHDRRDIADLIAQLLDAEVQYTPEVVEVLGQYGVMA